MDENLAVPDGLKIKEFRRKRGWSQTELAEAAKASKDSIWRWENGHPAQRTYLRDVAKALDKELDDIILHSPGSVCPSVRVSTVPVSRAVPTRLTTRISTAKLPSTSPVVFGRDAELSGLSSAWDDDAINVLVILGWAGTGKTALVNAWLNSISADNYRGAEAIFGWSFFSQGVNHDEQASDDFLAAALEWFGDPLPNRGSMWDKGGRLAEIIKNQRALLVLDGLEPLQYPPGDTAGSLRDPGLRSLVRELGRQNSGLCIITSRVDVDDLKEFVGRSVRILDLSNLAVDSAVEYLRSLGANGTTRELELAATEYSCHALALTLLGRFVATALLGDMARRDTLPNLEKEVKHGAHATRIMKGYQGWFAGKPELQILRLLGLFDRPAERSAIAALISGPPLALLTDKLTGVSELEWQVMLATLRDSRLLEPDRQHVGLLDCHPLVRGYFSEELRSQSPAAWQTGHARLFEHYKGIASALPDTTEKMSPLFHAVAHGCLAGQYQSAFQDVLRQRIQRMDQYYNSRVLGAVGAELGALYYFFERRWTLPVAALGEYEKAFVLSAAGFRLRALGRLTEAIEAMSLALKIRTQLEAWKDAAYSAASLGEVHLLIGDTFQALQLTSEAIGLADKSADQRQRILSRSLYAAALHATGHLEGAHIAFTEAEAIQASSGPQRPYLHSVDGSLYAELLIERGEYLEVSRRAKHALEVAEENSWLLELGLAYLMLGRAEVLLHLTAAISEGATAGIPMALGHLDAAVVYLHRAGRRGHLPRAILARAAAFAVQGVLSRAEAEANEALAIAKEGFMRLYEIDCHIVLACVTALAGKSASAISGLRVAEALIEQTNYRRREGVISRVAAAIDDRAALLKLVSAF